MLLDADGEIVGAHLAFYSEREIDGRRERFCNLGAFCVLEEHRFHSLRLLKALLAQDGYTFTDLSPSGNVVELNRRLEFRSLDTAVALVPNLPWPSRPRRDVVTSDPAVIERTLTGEQLALYRDHKDAAAGRHIVLIRGRRVVLRDRPQGPPQGRAAVRERAARERPGAAAPDGAAVRAPPAAAPRRARPRWPRSASSGAAPRLSVALRSPRQKMFRSHDLEPAQIDYLYSELVCVSW